MLRLSFIEAFRVIMSDGELAQLAQSICLYAEGQRFESVILHAIYGICFFGEFEGVYVYIAKDY